MELDNIIQASSMVECINSENYGKIIKAPNIGLEFDIIFLQYS